MLTNLVAMSYSEIASLPSEPFIQRISAQNGTCGDLVLIAESCPPFHIHVRLQQTTRSDEHIGLNHAELADFGLRPNRSRGMYPRSRSNVGRRVNGHNRSKALRAKRTC